MSTPARMRAQQASGKANSEAPRELRNYRLGERVGQEELSTVYQAVHQTLDRPVLVHILRRTDWVSASRFQLAARLAARLSHPNLLPVIDAGHDDRYGDYIITPLLEARSLADMLADGPLEPITSLRIATQVAAALDYLHSQGIIHRDVQPSSVQVTPQNLAYLTNLTLAASSDTPDLSSLAEADSFTPYSAPEQRFDQNDAAPTLDVYSLGALIFHMVSGDVPPAPGAELPSLANRDPALTGVDQVLRRMLAAGPTARYPSAGAAVAALRQAMRFQLDHASADMEESRWEPVAEWLENPLEAALGDTLTGEFADFLSNSRKRADDLHRHNVIRRLLNRWSRGGFFRKQNLGQLVQPEQIVSYNLYFYELRTIYETRTAPEPRLRPREADEPAALLPSPSVWDVQVPSEVQAAERTQELLLPNSARLLTCTTCGGEGKCPCKQCNGKGTIERTQTTRDAEGTTRKELLTETCPLCQGYGTQPCPTCKGSGEMIEEQVFTWARHGRQWNNTDDLEDLPVRRVEAAARPVFSGPISVYEGRWHSVAPLAELLRSAIDHVGDDTRLVEAELRINGSQVTEMDYQLNEKEHHLFILGEENVLVGDHSLLNIERISIAVLLVLTVLLAVGWLLLVR